MYVYRYVVIYHGTALSFPFPQHSALDTTSPEKMVLVRFRRAREPNGIPINGSLQISRLPMSVRGPLVSTRAI